MPEGQLREANTSETVIYPPGLCLVFTVRYNRGRACELATNACFNKIVTLSLPLCAYSVSINMGPSVLLNSAPGLLSSLTFGAGSEYGIMGDMQTVLTSQCFCSLRDVTTLLTTNNPCPRDLCHNTR